MKTTSCNIKICCQCTHNIVGVENTAQYQRCKNKGYEFEPCEEVDNLIKDLYDYRKKSLVILKNNN